MLPAPPAFVPGYLVYLADILVPGIGVAELLGVWRKDDGLAERLGYSIALGLSVDTLVLLIRASGFTVLGFRLLGLDQGVVYFLIGIGVFSLAASFAVRRSFSILLRPTKVEAVLLLVILIQLGTVLLFFQKYPIFPAYPSQDFRNHAEEAQGLVNGSIAMLPGGLMYYAVVGQIALSLLTVGGFALSTAERTMAILAVLSPLVVYLAATRLFSNRMLALLVASLYSLSGTVWYLAVFDSGLYPNFYGILAALFMIVSYVDAVNRELPNPKWAVFLFALVNFYMSHYSVIALLPTFLAVPLYQLIKDRSQFKANLIPSLAILLPAAITAAIFPGLYQYVIALIQNVQGNFISFSYLGGVLSGIPVLGYMAGEVNDDVQFVILMFLLVVYLVKFRSGSSLLAFPVVWFFSMMAAPLGIGAWRFAFEAIVPLLLMAGFAIHSLTLEQRKPGKKRPRTNISKGWRSGIIVGVLVVPMLATSWVPQSVMDSLTYTSLVNSSQNAVYNATVWMALNTPKNTTFLSLTDWHFSYLNRTIGRAIGFDYFSDPNKAVEHARQIGATYVIVTFVVTLTLPPGATNLYPWNTFPGNATLSLAYSNSDVRIYKVS